jgi:hypothetical protein
MEDGSEVVPEMWCKGVDSEGSLDVAVTRRCNLEEEGRESGPGLGGFEEKVGGGNRRVFKLPW